MTDTPAIPDALVPPPSELDAVIVALLCSDDHELSQTDCYLNNLGIVQEVRAGAEHDGDCTSQCHTCFVCLIADTEKRAKAFLNALPDQYRADQARTAALESASEWHIMQAKISRQSAFRYPEDSDDRTDLLTKAIWHYDCVSAIRSLSHPTEDGGR